MSSATAAVAMLLLVAAPLHAAPTSDQPSAIVIFPYLVTNSGRGIDTNVRLTNTSNNALAARCFYENHTAHCDVDGAPCDRDRPCGGTAQCTPGFSITEFVLRLARQQPVEWQLGPGSVALPGAGTVPPAPEQPFVGVLRCVATDVTGLPIGANALIGSATIQTEQLDDEPPAYDWARYRAVGLQAISDEAGGSNELALGGVAGPFAGCRNVQVLTHSYDGVRSPANPDRTVDTTLVMVPCAVDLHAALPATVTVQYRNFNEFDQQVVADEITVTGQRVATLGQIDPALTAAAAGTVTGQTRFLRMQGGGLVAIAIESHRAPGALPKTAALALAGMGEIAESDMLVLPPFGTPATPTLTPTPTSTGSPTQTPLPPDVYEPDNQLQQAKPIACGETQARSIHVARDDDWARLTLEAPSGILAAAVGPGLTLYNADGESLSDPNLARIDLPCGEQSLAAGSYYIQARGGFVVPSYSLSLSCTPCILPTATPAPTDTPTQVATPTVSGCAGDCDASGDVTVAELVRGVNILLGELRTNRCPAFDVNGNERVTVDELVRGVNALLRGCS